MKVIGIGLNKTGTTSLGVCFEHWGMSHVACNDEAFGLWCKGDIDSLLEWVGRYDSLENWPWALIYKEIDEAFPGTKFILTRRKTADAWFNSLSKHAGRTGPTDFRKIIFGHAMPDGHKEEHIRFYESHVKAVREYFKDRPDSLLDVCWEDGDGWSELAGFLGLEQPDMPFPHAHKSPTRFEESKRRVKTIVKALIGRRS